MVVVLFWQESNSGISYFVLSVGVKILGREKDKLIMYIHRLHRKQCWFICLFVSKIELRLCM